MILSSKHIHNNKACRSHYRFLSRECLRQGLDLGAIRKSANELSQAAGELYYLKSDAYKPTGIALGCPLPDKRVEKQLWRLSKLLNRFLMSLRYSNRKTFAFVPPDWYHITLVNRSHFDYTAITMLTEKEMEEVQSVIPHFSGNPIILHLYGLLLTNTGRLIAQGFPCNDCIYEMRLRIIETLPQLRINVPIAAHIKLGHVLTMLNADELKKFLSFIAQCGKQINVRLVIDDLYTPVGRIKLKEKDKH